MKRGKYDEKIMEPLFPRLHVNDTEKGGPRAPPRNKMALYEQLSIPSQRLNPGLLPLNPSNTSSLVPPSSSSQGSSHERNMFLPPRVSLSTSTNLAEKIHTRQLGGASVNAPVAQLEPRKVRDEDDFLVPVFVNSETGRHQSKNNDGFDGEKLTPSSATYPGHQVELQNVCDNDPNRRSCSVVSLRKEVKDQSGESSKVCSNGERLVKTAADLSTGEKIDGCTKEDNVSSDQDCGELPTSRLNRSHENDSCSPQKLRAGRKPTDNGCIDDAALTIETSEGILSQKRSRSYSVGNHSIPDETNDDSECRGDKTCVSLHSANADKTDDVSETSMVVSGLDISPDDVVGILGQKHFWKARRFIVNQQRLFAVQVFELHRLIKVQRLIAGSPHLLVEDMAYLGKPSFKGSPVKKLPLEIIVKALPHTKPKGDSEKRSHKMECSAENAVGRTSLSSVKNGSQPSNYGPFIGNPPPSPVNGNNTMDPWCLNQMVGQQWLVPVMSPSEGLIYKPYPGPGFMGSACGGCGPFGQTPIKGNFSTSAYGVPAPPHQGLGVLPGPPPFGHYYFPPYGMPVMNPALSGSAVEEMNQFAGPGSHGQSGLLSGGGANMQHQSSCNLPKEKNSAILHAGKFQASKHTELQGSTASSPGERLQKDGTESVTEGKNTSPFSPTAPGIPEGASQPHDTEQRTRVIRVVPHNPQSATESAAWIFQSIQKERKQQG